MLPEKLSDFFRAQKVSFTLDCRGTAYLMEYVVALANSGGGVIRIDCRDTVYFPSSGLDPSLELVSFEEDGITYIYVPDGPMKPYSYNGRVTVVRDGNVVSASHDDIIKLSGVGLTDFSSKTVLNVPDSFFDKNQLRIIIEKLFEVFGTGITSPLESAGLIRDGLPTAALILLAGKDPTIYFPHAAVIVEGYGVLRGNIPTLLNKLYQLVSGKLAEVLKNQGLTEDKIHDCLKALVNEIFINSLVHRDYTVPFPNVVTITETAIEVWNPGVVAGENPAPDPSFVFIRNPLLYRFAGFLGLAATSGSGILKLKKFSLLCNLGSVTHEVENGGIKATLNIKATYHSRRLTERERKLLEYIKNTGYITRKDYERIMGVSERTARLDLSNLVKRGILKKVGKGKNTTYELA